jgi:hypothetical protein
MSFDNSLELVINVDASHANKELQNVNTNLSGVERQMASTSRTSSAHLGQFESAVVRSRNEITHASHAAHLLGSEIGLELPRAVRRFIAESQLLGTVLTAAFNIAVYAAIAKSIYEIAEKYHLIPPALKEIFEESRDWKKENEEIAKSIGGISEKIAEARRQYGLLGLSGSARTKQEISQQSAGFGGLVKQDLDIVAQMQEREKILRITLAGQNYMSPSAVPKAWINADENYQNLVLQHNKVLAEITLKSWESTTLKKRLILQQEAEAKQIADANERLKQFIDSTRAQLAQSSLGFKLHAAMTNQYDRQTFNNNYSITPEMQAALQASQLEAANGAGVPEWWTKRIDDVKELHRENESMQISILKNKKDYLGVQDLELQQLDELKNKYQGNADALIEIEARKKLIIERTNIDDVKELHRENESMQISILKNKKDYLGVQDLELQQLDELKNKYQGNADALIEIEARKKLIIERTNAEMFEQTAKDAQDRIREIRDAAGHIFDDLISGSKNIWRSMFDAFRNIFLAPIRVAFQNLAASIFAGGSRTAPAVAGASSGIAGSYGGLIGGLGSLLTPPTSATGGSSSMRSIMYEYNKTVTGGEEVSAANGSPSGNRFNLLNPATGGIFTAPSQALMGLGGMGGLGLMSYGIGHNNALLGGLGGFFGGGFLGMAIGSSSLLAGTALGAFAGPIGALLGLGIGVIASIFHKSAEQKVKEKIKTTYGVDMKSPGVLHQIVELAKQSYGSDLDMCIRSQQVQDLVRLYAMTTGQRASQLAAQMSSSTLIQNSSGVYQQATYSNGSVVSYSGGLPGAGLDSIASGSASAAAPVVINIAVPGAKQFFQKETVSVIANSPRAVQSASIAASQSNYQRRNLALLQMSPMSLRA